ncbi:MAG TPA: hypothetical protein VHM90_17145 [Phycisphaerae bacterium]|nr:hypothetical protein [Phycisphaerae bacterium]
MKHLSCFLSLLLVSGTAFATNVGDTYEQVVAEKGKPRSQIDAGARRLLQYSDATIELRDNVVTSVKAVTAPPPAATPPPKPAPTAAAAPKSAPKPAAPPTNAKMLGIKREFDQAVARVKEIVNQPVTMVQRTSQMKVGVFGPGGWFHEHAETPDFDTVDVRKTQSFDYARWEFVSSDLNPGVAFLGRELEFNPMTKYFYTDRTLPKKKLTEAEMLEINDLYRVIGRCVRQLQQQMDQPGAVLPTKG